MKLEERMVYDYLKVNGYKNIVYEPDGNITPDFLVENIIAIEVRRLNQHFDLNSEKEPLEKLNYSIQTFFKKIIINMEIGLFEDSALITIRLKRPLSIDKKLRNKITDILYNHIPVIKETRTYAICENLEIEIFPSENKLDLIYHIGRVSDLDSAGFIVKLQYENMKMVIKEKEKKVEPHKNKYKIWWLALVDTIGYGMTELDLDQFYKLPKIKMSFEKVLLISPLNPKDGIVLLEK